MVNRKRHADCGRTCPRLTVPSGGGVPSSPTWGVICGNLMWGIPLWLMGVPPWPDDMPPIWTGVSPSASWGTLPITKNAPLPRNVNRQTPVKTVPYRRTSYAVGKNPYVATFQMYKAQWSACHRNCNWSWQKAGNVTTICLNVREYLLCTRCLKWN